MVEPEVFEQIEAGQRATASLLGAYRETLRQLRELQEEGGLTRVTAELEALGAEVTKVRNRNVKLQDEIADLERQNSNYLSLYVASSQLHSNLTLDQVVRNVKEAVINLVGADCLALYLLDEGGTELVLEGVEGEVEGLQDRVPLGGGLLARVARAKTVRLDIGEDEAPEGPVPLAIVPLAGRGQLVGLLVVYRLLVHKDGFDHFDMELFGLLAAHAGAALMSSLEFRKLERKVTTLEALVALFKERQFGDRGL